MSEVDSPGRHSGDGENNGILAGQYEDEDPEEDPEQVDEPMQGNGGVAIHQVDLNILANGHHGEQNNQPAPGVPAFRLLLYNGMVDDELLQMVRDSGFVVPVDAESQKDIVSRLRQLDQP